MVKVSFKNIVKRTLNLFLLKIMVFNDAITNKTKLKKEIVFEELDILDRCM